MAGPFYSMAASGTAKPISCSSATCNKCIPEGACLIERTGTNNTSRPCE